MLASGLILLYLLAAYLVVPLVWKRYVHRHPVLDDVPGITLTADGHPGDPINVALIGTEAEVKRSDGGRWDAADPLGLRSRPEDRGGHRAAAAGRQSAGQ